MLIDLMRPASTLPLLANACLMLGCSSDSPSEPSMVNALEGQGAGNSPRAEIDSRGGNTASPGMGGSPAGSASEGMNPDDIANVPMAGAGGAGTTPMADVVTDEFVADVAITVHPEVNSLLVVTWNQVREAERTYLEFGIEGESAMTSRPGAGALGARRDVVIGVPGDTDVTVRIVSELAGTRYRTSDHLGHTDPVPAGMPEPEVEFNAALARPDRWLFGSVEESIGGGPQNYLTETFWLYIMDRGRGPR
jgi:hypothetical protein